MDDEETLCEALRFNIEEEGFEADVAYSAEEALALDLSSYSLFILDVMMGDISGTQLAKIIKSREDTKSIPIIFCTARDSGADDYITKPYSIRNVLARIRAVLRRTVPPENKENQPALEHKGLKVYPESKMCVVDGNEIKLPKKEFEILSLMIANKGKIFTREELLSRIWPEQVVVVDRVVDVNITRLRSKIGTYGKNIVTRSGYGYGFQV